MTHIRITITCPDPGLRSILIAHLAEMGYDGFEEEGDLLHAWVGASAFSVPDLEALFGSLPTDTKSTTGHLAATSAITWQQELVPEKNWNEEWERSFQPVVIGDFVAVRADFHAPISGVRHELVITPKMSFGTGHHATTWMMLEAMAHIDFRRRSVLDFGTGTGVLAILADRLGATRILAIDHDDWSIENARENIDLNDAPHIELSKMSNIISNDLFSIILANVNKNVILHEISAMEQHLEQNGVLLLSGLLLDDEQDLQRAAARHHLTISYNGRMTKGNWLCLKLVRIKN